MKVVLISCVSKKMELAPNQKVAAKDLYVSTMFRLAWQYAQTFKPDRIYILSAKHGLLRPDTEIASYNQTLNSASAAKRREWADEVMKSLRNEGIDPQRDEVIILAGQNYSRYLAPQIAHCRQPYRENGCKGMGYILKFLKDEIEKSK